MTGVTKTSSGLIEGGHAMWTMGKQWAIARKSVLMVAVAALLVGGGLGAGLAGLGSWRFWIAHF